MKQDPKPTPKKPSEVDIQSLETKLKRALADYQNLENRMRRESSLVVQFATVSLVSKLLSVRDHLEMASANLKDQSLAMILDQLDKILSDEDVQEINCQGEFDPNTMECQESVPGEKNQVINVVTRGYILRDRVLRPAIVTVGTGVSKTSPKI
ncbi:MAG: Protein GrpE [Microgenomates group bacterium GW2011_GWF2_47_9]|nr:MAG: Protein GrpE [Microgenomates group bacterium GW2011_GWF2_47_9]